MIYEEAGYVEKRIKRSTALASFRVVRYDLIIDYEPGVDRNDRYD